jgi:hypothetical protein
LRGHCRLHLFGHFRSQGVVILLVI